MAMIDYLHSEEGDLIIKGGDWLTGESSQTHQKGLLLLINGQLRSWPTAGVALVNFILGENDKDVLRHRITEELEADGLTVELITFLADGTIQIEAQYGT